MANLRLRPVPSHGSPLAAVIAAAAAIEQDDRLTFQELLPLLEANETLDLAAAADAATAARSVRFD